MRDEELAGLVDQQVVQRYLQAGALGQAKVAPDGVELRHERSVPAAPVDRDPTGRNLPGVTHATIEARLGLVAVACQQAGRAQFGGRGRRDREPDASHTLDLES